MSKIKTNDHGIGRTVRVEGKTMQIIDRAPGKPGAMWAVEIETGHYYKVRLGAETRSASVDEGPMRAGGAVK